MERFVFENLHQFILMLTTIERERFVDVVNSRGTNKEGGSSVGHDEEGEQKELYTQ
jgi:hypothetical protein